MMRKLLLVLLVALIGPVLVLGLVLTPLAMLRQLCYRLTSQVLLRAKWQWRDPRPIDVELPNRRARRAAKSHRGAVGEGYRGRR
jgi:hypothetical protein